MRMFKREEGFTLVELMVVVLIIGILLAIAIPVFNAATATSQRRACFDNQRTVEGAIETYLASSPTATVPANQVGTPAVLVPAYIKVAPECPTGAGQYDWVAADKELTCDTHGHFQ